MSDLLEPEDCASKPDFVCDAAEVSQRAAQLAARAAVEDRKLVSEEIYDGEVVVATRSYAWVRPFTAMELPDDVQKALVDMNEGIRRKAARTLRRPWCNGLMDNVVYIGILDIDADEPVPRVGSTVSFKLYWNSKGVGGREVRISDAGPPQTTLSPVPVGPVPQSEQAIPGIPNEEKPSYSVWRGSPYFLQEGIVDQRVLVDGWYEGEVIKRMKSYAWVKPNDPSQIPLDVQAKMQEMCDGFRAKAVDGSGRMFCDGMEDNVVYCANADLASRAHVLMVGMKIRFQLYTNSKGVGTRNVSVSGEHFSKIVDAVQQNFANDEGKKKALQLESVFGSGIDDLRNVLFIGECTHAFTVALGRYLRIIPQEGEPDTDLTIEGKAHWCSSELKWPREGTDLYVELARNLQLLRSHGIWCTDGTDAHNIKFCLERSKCPCLNFDVVFWMMPYLPDNVWRPYETIAPLMKYWILTFVAVASAVLASPYPSEEGIQSSIVVVVTSGQLLSWELRQPITARVGSSEVVLYPEVRWFDVAQFTQHGYTARFGDGRDRHVDRPAFHNISDLVAVRWRVREACQGQSVSTFDVDGVTDEEIRERKKVLENVGRDPISQAETITPDDGGSSQIEPGALDDDGSPPLEPNAPEIGTDPREMQRVI